MNTNQFGSRLDFAVRKGKGRHIKKALSLALGSRSRFRIRCHRCSGIERSRQKRAERSDRRHLHRAAGGKGVFSGSFAITRFEAKGNQLYANGYLTGTLTDSAGLPVGSVMKSVAIPVSLDSSPAAAATVAGRQISTQATCDVLLLILGPLHLDLLGLTVDLNQVVLDIAAQTGAGNLLGNLLCAVVGLLDGVGTLIDIANLLNQILDILADLLD